MKEKKGKNVVKFPTKRRIEQLMDNWWILFLKLKKIIKINETKDGRRKNERQTNG